jgi:hypothetical protein
MFTLGDKIEENPVAEAAEKEKQEDESNKNNLWFEKYKPMELKDLVGNIEAVTKFKTWLNDWHNTIIVGKKKK